LSIPSEIVDVLRKFHGYALCIKGDPGTGKTAFVLTILRELCRDGNGVYVSTRLEAEKLYSMFPWAREAIPPGGVIDAANSPRMESPNLADHIIYRTMPEFLGALYAKVSQLKDPVVAIDSWDAVVQTAKESASMSLDGMMIEFASETGSRILLVTETRDQKPLDYMVDGIVELGLVDDRRDVYRYLQIRKLRGSGHDLRKYVLEITSEGLEVKGFLYE